MECVHECQVDNGHHLNNRQTETVKHRVDRQRQTDRQTDRQTATDRQTDRQTDRHQHWCQTLCRCPVARYSNTRQCLPSSGMSTGLPSSAHALYTSLLPDVTSCSNHVTDTTKSITHLHQRRCHMTTRGL